MNKKNSFIVAFAIMSVYLITMSDGALAPALASISAAFPNVPMSTIYLITTMPALLVIPSSLIAGTLAGNKVKYKTLIIIGILLFITGGIAPAFANNFTLILIGRAVFGIGFGIISPMGNALVISVYEGNKRASMLGLGAVIMNLGAVILQMSGGMLTNIRWNYSFFSHGLAILSLILVLIFLTEPAKAEQPSGAEKEKMKIRGGVWLTALLIGIAVIFIYPSFLVMSEFLIINGLGGPAVTGMVLSLFTVGGIVGGFIYGPVYKAIKKYIIAFGCILGAIGYALIIYSGNIIFITIGSSLIGVSLSILMPAAYMISGMICSPREIAFSTSILLASINVFVFLSNYWVSMIGAVTGDFLAMPMVYCMIGLAIGAVIFIIVNPLPKPKDAAQNE